MTVSTLGLDADDTLWHSESHFAVTEQRFGELLSPWLPGEEAARRLLERERANLRIFGYGVKGFTLSMIETAIEVTEDRVPARVIRELIEAGQEMLRHPIELLPHARDAVEAVAGDYTVLLITKGDLLDQERKLAQSGLGDLFDGVEIVSQKTPDIYRTIFQRHGDGPDRALMVGNSMKSDVVPVIEAGGWGVYVPHGLEWALEHAPPPTGHDRFRELAHLGALPDLVAEIG